MANSKHLYNIKTSYFIWFLGAFFFFIDYVLRVSPSILTPTLMQHFNTNAFTIGSFSAFFYYAYIGMQIPVGILVDRYGPTRLLIMSALICALSTFMFAGMNNISAGLLSRFLMGFGASFAFVGTLKLVSVWFNSSQFAFLAGLTQSMGMLGAMVGQGPMGQIYQTFGWRNTLYGLAVLFLFLTLLMAIFFKDKALKNPREDEQSHENGNYNQLPNAKDSLDPTQIKIWDSFKIIFTNPQNLLNCLFIGLLYAPSACFGEQWGASFLSLSQGISIEAAGQETGIMFIGLAIGCPILGFFSDKIQRRLLVMRVSALICFILLSVVIYGKYFSGDSNLSPTLYTLILFIYGFFNSGIVVSYALASEISPRRLTGVALGITNMASVIIGALMIPIVGFLLDYLWSGNSLNGLRIFDIRDYQIAFATLPLGLIAAFIISFFQKETYCKRIQ